jgi:hypothetical protein
VAADQRRPGRLQQISQILGVAPEFFFLGAPGQPNRTDGKRAPPVEYVTDFIATAEGIALIKAFMRLPSTKLRRRVVALVEELTAQTDSVRCTREHR